MSERSDRTSSAATPSSRREIECECCGETFPTRIAAEDHAGAPDFCGFTPAELVEVEA